MSLAVNDNTLAPNEVPDREIEAMLAAGLHVGHNRARRNPGMTPFLWGVRSNIEIIDLTKTKERLDVALEFLKDLALNGKIILFVGTRPSARGIIRETAHALGFPSVTERWVGGALTNFKIILKRIETLEALESERASGGFEKYTKKEQAVKEQEIGRLKQRFDGLRLLRRLPDAVFIADIVHDAGALREARRIGVPIVAITDTNADPRLVTYPIPANDDAKTAIEYVFSRVADAIQHGASARAAATQAVPVVEPA